jgi:ectoine hydroxylase-related dioxygenase (phytanoyl-CoA dioxygenase family)
MLNEAQREQLSEQGFCIVPSALQADTLARVRAALDSAAEDVVRNRKAHDGRLDPNDANIRIYNLPAIAPVFIDLLRHEAALGAMRALLGPGAIVSNFTANVALPGSGSMKLHSDQALVVPAPWFEPWAANVVWCLDDVHEANGSTRYLPGSHRYRTADEVPADAVDRTVAFEARAGSFIVMEGRLWHTSGCNVTRDERRRMLFAYYSTDFVRQQANWAFALPHDVQAAMDEDTRKLFGLEAMGNVRIGGALTRLKPA